MFNDHLPTNPLSERARKTTSFPNLVSEVKSSYYNRKEASHFINTNVHATNGEKY
jgi:hypothetical protein